MGLRDTFMDLEPHESRAALMRAAGMTEAAIAQFLDTDQVNIKKILQKPQVARYLLALTATMATDLAEASKNLSESIEREAVNAFHVEKTVMDRLFKMEENVRAQLGAASTAQDILDRAGKRAPTKVQTEVTHTIDAEALAHVASVLEEVHRAPAIDVTEYRNGHKESDGLAGEEAPE
jgi:predicted amino acid-binding ACT domain protein